ncbi:hypothetical protein [Xanthomonas phage vB_XooS_NR08]|nr:hypothetical protein [Xanthomonas phage vB_XooS_NR08]
MTIVDIVINYFTELASTGIRSLVIGFIIAALVILLWPVRKE